MILQLKKKTLRQQKSNETITENQKRKNLDVKKNVTKKASEEASDYYKIEISLVLIYIFISSLNIIALKEG